jgi:hypothetical protein
VRFDTVSKGLEVTSVDSLSLEGSGRTGATGDDSDGGLSSRSEHYVDDLNTYERYARTLRQIPFENDLIGLIVILVGRGITEKAHVSEESAVRSDRSTDIDIQSRCSTSFSTFIVKQ